ncbi:MAG: anion permease [Deltaproteobacteria bacterium]|jgi:di/tricarboxylate transporter|nr:anion permease [Deltaproteobacteria bacterium]
MKTTTVKEPMVPLKDYATVPGEVTLRETVLALEKALMTLAPSGISIVPYWGWMKVEKVASKITIKNILIALETNFGKVEGIGVLERSGYSPEGGGVHDPALAKYLLFSLCFALNMGGPGTPSAGGRNVIIMGFFTEYGIPITYSGWMQGGWPLVPLGSTRLLLYMATLFSKKIKTRDLTPGLQHIKEETRRLGKMKYPEYVTAGTLFLIVALWIFGGEATGLGGPAILALVIPVLFKTVKFGQIIERISFNAWFMYCGALTPGCPA